MDELPLSALFSSADYEHWRAHVFTVQRSNPTDPALSMQLGSRAVLFEGHIYVEMVAAGLRKDVRLDTLMVGNNIVLPLTIPSLANRDDWESAAVAAAMLHMRGVVIVVCVLVIVLLSKTSIGTSRLSQDSRRTAELVFSNMQKWHMASTSSRHPLASYTNAVYALAYANVLRNMLDDAQSRKLFNVSMLQKTQSLERLVNMKAREMSSKCPALGQPQQRAGMLV